MTLSLPPEEPSAGPWQVELLQTLVQRLTDDAPDAVGRPVIIAIDGRSASGKTTLAAVLSKAVPGSALVHTDDIAWHHSFFDWTELLLEGILEPVRTGENVEYRPPAWEERGREGAIYVPSGCPMLILEGVGAARRELMHVVDSVVWVQADPERARARGITRDGGDASAAAFWDEWMAEEFPFLAQQRPWERADVIVAGTPDLEYDPAFVVVAVRNQ